MIGMRCTQFSYLSRGRLLHRLQFLPKKLLIPVVDLLCSCYIVVGTPQLELMAVGCDSHGLLSAAFCLAAP